MHERSAENLPSAFKLLTKGAERLGVPFTYDERAEGWAEFCRLFLLVEMKAGNLTRKQYMNAMSNGFAATCPNKTFPRGVFERIFTNMAHPAFPGRTAEVCVVDTLLASGKSVPNDLNPTDDEYLEMLKTILTDPGMGMVGALAVTPDPELWDDVVQEYHQRRPSFFQRLFNRPESWLFGA